MAEAPGRSLLGVFDSETPAGPGVLARDGVASVLWLSHNPRLAEWPAERMRVVLLHELATVRRGDWILQMAAEALRCVW